MNETVGKWHRGVQLVPRHQFASDPQARAGNFPVIRRVNCLPFYLGRDSKVLDPQPPSLWQLLKAGCLKQIGPSHSIALSLIWADSLLQSYSHGGKKCWYPEVPRRHSLPLPAPKMPPLSSCLGKETPGQIYTLKATRPRGVQWGSCLPGAEDNPQPHFIHCSLDFHTVSNPFSPRAMAQHGGLWLTQMLGRVI